MNSNIFKYLIICLAIGSIASDCGEEELDPNYNIDINVWFEIEPVTGSINSTFTYIIDPAVWGYADDDELNNDVEEFQWDFDYTGGGEYSFDTEVISEKTITHIYTVPGTYTVVLKATVEDKDAVKYLEKELIVTEATNTPPTATFSISPEMGNILTEFKFDASDCTDDITSSSLLEVKWDFENDGTWDTFYSIDKIAKHYYDTVGVFDVKMNVRDGDGNVSELIKSLTVENCNEGGEPCPGLAFIIIDGEQYNTVQIGDQCWLNRNLNRGTYLESVSNQTNQTNNEEIEKFCYENDLENCQTYGGLYQWDEMMNYSIQSNQGICPNEWHVPTLDDWHQLVDFLGGEIEASGKLKSCTDDWKFNQFAVNSNESGFTVLPAGIRLSNSPFQFITEQSSFWASTKVAQGADMMRITYNYAVAFPTLAHFKSGFSVRCLKND